MSAANGEPAEPNNRTQRRILWTIIAAIAAVVITTALILFQPWLLFIDVRVDDDIPPVAATSPVSPTAMPSTDTATAEPSPTPEPPQHPIELSRGSFISHEHETTGVVRVIEQPDGSRVLVLEGLATTNGPDVHVWLSAGPVVEGFDGWFTAGGYDHVDLGMIKGNIGDQVYEIPAEVDLAAYPTVDLWCVQFAVSFGAAALMPA